MDDHNSFLTYKSILVCNHIKQVNKKKNCVIWFYLIFCNMEPLFPETIICTQIMTYKLIIKPYNTAMILQMAN